MKFKRTLNKHEISAACAEWLYRHGHKIDLDVNYAIVVNGNFPPEHPDVLNMTFTVEAVVPADVHYEVKE